jgi:PAS domain S-box-containing protein
LSESKINHDQFSPTELLIQHEQTRLLHESLPVSAAATLANAGILSFVQWNVIDHTVILVWLGVMTLVTTARVKNVYLYKQKSPDYHQSIIWKQRFQIGTIAAGMTWGGAAIFLFPENALPNQVLLAFVIAGICAGAVSSLSFMLLPVRAFLILSLFPIIIKFLLGDTSIMVAMGVMSLLFFATLWVSSQRIYLNTLQNISLRYESAGRQHALKESEARYRLIFDSAPVGIVQFDHAGSILALNGAFEELIGEPGKNLIGRNLLTDVMNEGVVQEVSKALKGETGYFTGISHDVAGARDVPLRAYFRGLGVEGNSKSGGVGIFEDISEDKRVERMKDEFISTVSHELRTPLTSIRGSLGLLSMKLMDELPENMGSMLDIANRNTERLLLLINDILDVSKIEAGKMEFNFEEIEVMPFLENVLEVNHSYGREHQVEFKISHRQDDLFLQGDHHRLMQVFSNLLSNAAKFSRKGSTVDMAVYKKETGVRFEVIDRGYGIPEQFHSRVFEKFAQYDSSDTRSAGGTGLGLSITRAIVERHGGKIGFISREGEGTTFYIELPLLQDRTSRTSVTS